jgi:hypothetical protein
MAHVVNVCVCTQCVYVQAHFQHIRVPLTEACFWLPGGAESCWLAAHDVFLVTRGAESYWPATHDSVRCST